MRLMINRVTKLIGIRKLLKGVEIDHLFYNKISDLTPKSLFLDNVLILMKIVAKTRPRFQYPLLILIR